MLATSIESRSPSLDSSRSIFEFIHQLLSVPLEEQANLDGLLETLSAAFAVSGAGLASYPEATPVSIHPPRADLSGDVFPPWQQQPDSIERLPRSRLALTFPCQHGGSCLVTVVGNLDRGRWLLWLEDTERTSWSSGEAALLVLVGQAILHVLSRDETLASWAKQMDRAQRRQRMEDAARLVRRLAHDFGNVLTGILGFSELALSQPIPANSSLQSYISEIHRGTQGAAEYTNQLRLFARRQASSSRSCQLSNVLAQEEQRLRPLLGAHVQLRADLPDGLPAVAVESELLRQALAIVLDNAREAIAGSGFIEITARPVEVTAGEALEFLGDVRPGPHLEIRVADSGGGLSVEAKRHLFTEPFFSTKPRNRGFGLAKAYGILSSHRGGLELLSRPEGGTIARLLVPLAELPAAKKPRTCEKTSPNERILIVDDDPMILQFTALTLERAGFCVQTASNSADALKKYSAAADNPFRMVLSDVLMPESNGMDLARRLLLQNSKVSILFMSGEFPAETVQQAFGAGRFELLAKPFRPDELVRAVRATLDRGHGMPTPENRVEDK